MKSINSVGENTIVSAFESVKSRAAEFWKYLRTTDKESIVSDIIDTWLLWKTIVKVYVRAVKTLSKRGPRIILDFKKYPYLLYAVDLRSFFRAVRGRKGVYRKSILKTLETMAGVCVEYFVEALSNPDRVIYFQGSIAGISELCRAMGLIPYSDLFMPILSVLLNPHSMEKYIDFAESSGIPADSCSVIKSAQGIFFKGQEFKAAAIIGNNMCEGQVNASLLYRKMKDIPLFTLAAPNNFKSDRAEEWFGKEIMRLVEWLEENTPGRMDWDRLREIFEERNRAVEAEMELWEMMRLQPAPLASEAIWLSHLASANLMSGAKEATEMFRTLVECAKENMEKGVGANPNERYRAVIWNPPMAVYWHVYRYLELKWGVSVIHESLAYNEVGFVDSSSKESMLRDVGKLLMNAPMAIIARGPAAYYLDPLFSIIKNWGVNLVLVSDHVGCKSAAAMAGMLRERARQEGIPVVRVPIDIMDTRFASKDEVFNKLDQFMETVMKAEPLRKKVPAV